MVAVADCPGPVQLTEPPGVQLHEQLPPLPHQPPLEQLHEHVSVCDALQLSAGPVAVVGEPRQPLPLSQPPPYSHQVSWLAPCGFPTFGQVTAVAGAVHMLLEHEAVAVDVHEQEQELPPHHPPLHQPALHEHEHAG